MSAIRETPGFHEIAVPYYRFIDLRANEITEAQPLLLIAIAV
jgi:hypothetical protein